MARKIRLPGRKDSCHSVEQADFVHRRAEDCYFLPVVLLTPVVARGCIVAGFG